MSAYLRAADVLAVDRVASRLRLFLRRRHTRRRRRRSLEDEGEHDGAQDATGTSAARENACVGRELPSGTVTFLFSDVEGSTRLLQEHGEAYPRVLAEHRRLLREAFARHDGVEVDTQGDAFFVAFARASDALAAARDAQAALEATPVRVRIGIHTGEPVVTEEGYAGLDVHKGARIAAAGHGGQVLVSEQTARLVVPEALRELGTHRLKDLTAPERIYQLGRGRFAPLKTLNATNLPVAASPLIGRHGELTELTSLLANGTRLR